jgi:hypothetical protein
MHGAGARPEAVSVCDWARGVPVESVAIRQGAAVGVLVVGGSQRPICGAAEGAASILVCCGEGGGATVLVPVRGARGEGREGMPARRICMAQITPNSAASLVGV